VLCDPEVDLSIMGIKPPIEREGSGRPAPEVRPHSGGPLASRAPGLEHPTAVVMNMFYTGLGIARSLAAHNVSVIGLSAKRITYGNFTRCAKVRQAPDSRSQPESLLRYLVALGKELGHRSVIFPTRDDDLVFLNRYRSELEPNYRLAIPSNEALSACLNKWETFQWAQKAGVSSPRCWRIETPKDLEDILASRITFPCVLKPLSAHHWRQGQNWEHVGSRKAVCVTSADQLRNEYEFIAQVERRALLQEAVPGGDDQLFVAACYLDAESKPVASFTAQKVIQMPEGFGTGCIVQGTERPEIVADAFRLLRAMQFTGVAEVEFKWDSCRNQHLLIEVNPRPWDQHRLGHAGGIDLIHLSYCYAAGLPSPVLRKTFSEYKWIAEDVFLLALIRSFWNRDGKILKLCKSARGRRIYGIWHPSDPIPAVVGFILAVLSLAAGVWKRMTSFSGRRNQRERLLRETHAQ
jgi:D-aspartate ligase